MLTLSAANLAALRTHGEETYPHECCGILLGHQGQGESQTNEVVDLLPVDNTRTDSAHNRYHIAPTDLIRAQREGRKRGLDIVGFYHSHPDHPAQWSPTDFAEAHWFGCTYVITAVAQGKAETTNAFPLQGTTEDDKRFEPEPIQTI